MDAIKERIGEFYYPFFFLAHELDKEVEEVFKWPQSKVTWWLLYFELRVEKEKALYDIAAGKSPSKAVLGTHPMANALRKKKSYGGKHGRR